MSIRKQLHRVLVEKESKALRQIFCVTGKSGIDFSQLQEASLSQIKAMIEDWMHSAEKSLEEGILPQRIIYVARSCFEVDVNDEDFYRRAMHGIRAMIRETRTKYSSFKEYSSQEEQLLARISLAIFVRNALLLFSQTNRSILSAGSDTFTEDQLAIIFNCDLVSVGRKAVSAQIDLLIKVASFVYSPEPEILVGAEKEFFECYERLSAGINEIFSKALERDFMPVKVRFTGEGSPDESGLTELEWQNILDIYLY